MRLFTRYVPQLCTVIFEWKIFEKVGCLKTVFFKMKQGYTVQLVIFEVENFVVWEAENFVGLYFCGIPTPLSNIRS